DVDLVKNAQALVKLENEIHEVVIGRPIERLISGLGLPGSSLMGSIIQQAPIDFIDQSLGAVRLGIEIGGISVGIMTGNLVLAYACLKALIHDLVHRMLVSAIKDSITGRHSGTSESGKS